MGFILYQNNNIVGVFETFRLAENMAKGILENGWATDFEIVEFKKNSCIKVNTTKVIDPKQDSDENTVSVSSEEMDTISESDLIEHQKNIIETTHNLNILKKPKERLDEKQRQYKIDLDLYYKFKSNLEEDISFEIPELFIEKYKIFHRLEQDNKLSWENFSTDYKEKDFHGNINNIFDINNTFENKFLESVESDDDNSSSSSSFDESDENTSDVIEIIEVIRRDTDSNTDSD